MRPGGLEDRLHHLVLASDMEGSLTCYAQAVLQARRDHRHIDTLDEFQRIQVGRASRTTCVLCKKHMTRTTAEGSMMGFESSRVWRHFFQRS